MADMLLCDHLKELWILIDQQHLSYLISDDSQGKIEQREKLEGYIREYLCVAPHNRKFTFPQTAQVLHRSASNKENFSAYKAAVAWNAIGKYADNLVVQPWRKEFQDVKMYCGFYKHEVEENLSNADLMFEAMGYCHAGNGTMTITDILDPDRITSVSKDAIIAYVECQVLKQIWENLSPHYHFSWLEILEFRENHTGTADQAVRSLTYKRRQRQYEEQMYRRTQCHSENHSRSDYAYGPSVGYFNQMHYPGHPYSYPVQSRFAPGLGSPHVISPSSVYPPQIHPSFSVPHAIAHKPQDLYPPNGYPSHSHYPRQVNSTQDSYLSHYHPQQSSVPTAQLIELDPAPNHDSYADRPHNTMRYSGEPDKWQDPESSFPSGKAKDDGAGSWENWDYVYRNLESQGYKKNLGSRGDIVPSKGNSLSRNNTSDSDSKAQGEITDKMRMMNVGVSRSDSNTKSASDVEEKNVRNAPEGSMRSVPESKGTSPEKSKKITVSRSETPNSEKVTHSKRETSETDSVTKITGTGREDADEEKWECFTCTYLNRKDKQICEMCCKSRERGGECKPQPSGGQECPSCTLVNEPGLNFCVACRKALKDSPTYI